MLATIEVGLVTHDSRVDSGLQFRAKTLEPSVPAGKALLSLLFAKFPVKKILEFR